MKKVVNKSNKFFLLSWLFFVVVILCFFICKESPQSKYVSYDLNNNSNQFVEKATPHENKLRHFLSNKCYSNLSNQKKNTGFHSYFVGNKEICSLSVTKVNSSRILLENFRENGTSFSFSLTVPLEICLLPKCDFVISNNDKNVECINGNYCYFAKNHMYSIFSTVKMLIKSEKPFSDDFFSDARNYKFSVDYNNTLSVNQQNDVNTETNKTNLSFLPADAFLTTGAYNVSIDKNNSLINLSVNQDVYFIDSFINYYLWYVFFNDENFCDREWKI